MEYSTGSQSGFELLFILLGDKMGCDLLIAIHWECQ